NAYPGINLTRTSALVKLPTSDKPLLIDIFKAGSDQQHQYDLPFWYKGHIVDASFKINASVKELKPLGDKYGYQHIWLNAQTQLDNSTGYISILNNKRFYTTHFTSEAPMKMKWLSIGAN